VSTHKGQAGEERAVRFLQRKGFTIIGRNLRLGRGELDVVAKQEDLLVFLEVKTHRTLESALLAVHPDKCSRLQSAARTWLGLHPNYAGLQCRFDLIIITPRMGLPDWAPPKIEHMEDIIR
jgi:putative endonuclease